MARGETRVSIDGRELNVSNLDKVLFPESGFTKGQLIEYYVKVAPAMLAHIADRPLTMKRFPDGVTKPFFYEKHVPSHAPAWVRTVTVPAHDNDEGITYVVLDDVASLAWAANLGTVEMHVPLWQVGTDRPLPAPPDLVVFDLDPGDGATIVECCSVAQWIRDALDAQGLASVAKTSGSKGLQVYARWASPMSWEESRASARGIAEALESDHPELVVSNMRKSLRTGKVLIDWSQNHQAKTTVAAYSVRGLAQPTVSTPVTWDEVAAGQRSGQAASLVFTTADVLERVEQSGDLFAALVAPADERSNEGALTTYRSKRDPKKTPEPMPDKPRRGKGKNVAQPSFVIQEHHARALHWDFRLEHDGVLVSWALPKGLPMDPKVNHLAVHTEDHPLSYEDFEGEIPAGEYGGGDVRIWDRGTYELEKWRDKEVMVVLHGERASGRYVLFPTGGKNWMIHRMDPAPPGFDPLPTTIRPMLATSGQLPTSDAGWAFEIKWDGVRAITFVDGGRITMHSRNDNDLTTSFPEFRPLGELLGARPCVLDGEIVVMGEGGRPDFGRLQRRLHVTSATAAKKLESEYPATYVIFDVLHLDGRDLTQLSYDERRAVLESLNLSGASFTTTVSFRDVKGADILRGTQESGLEGVIAKRRTSRYAAGRRSDEWIKVKNVRTQEVVIGGWTDGIGNRAGSLGALMLGIPEGKKLRYVGKVGTGFSDRDRRELLELLGRIARKTSPFLGPTPDASQPHFVRPVQVGEVTFGEWTAAGHLRHPSWRGLRTDKEPTDVVVEA
ncbi:MAG TPA: non-homologous end-joining DNA ligase [Acidimicrobiales bacterium]